MPSEAEVLDFAQAYPGDMARGIPATIPEPWALGWLAHKSGLANFPKKWRENFLASFRSDWITGHPKARAGLNPKKNAVQTDGRSPRQARFELSRELEAIQERLDACHEIGTEPSAADERREKELKLKLKELPE